MSDMPLGEPRAFAYAASFNIDRYIKAGWIVRAHLHFNGGRDNWLMAWICDCEPAMPWKEKHE